MFRCSLIFALLLAAASASAQGRFPGIGRAATPDEVRAWDIDVRPDLRGLPVGRGSVAKGQDVWEAKCASCHGVFGESNEVFPPIIGGTTKKDQETGRVAALRTGEVQRTTMMKLSQITTLWDYINRSMPWNNPKTLSVEEVYAVTAYILNLAEIVPDDFVLSDQNMAEVQKKLPNRNGKRPHPGLWDTRGAPDVRSVACMTNCPVNTTIQSTLPDYARDAHGNLADQHRLVGPVRGQVTVRNALAAAPQSSQRPGPAAADGRALANKNACLACHGVDSRLVGPGFREIAAKYQGDAQAGTRLFANVKQGGVGAWGPVPMPAQGHVNDDELKSLVQWILAGAR